MMKKIRQRNIGKKEARENMFDWREFVKREKEKRKAVQERYKAWKKEKKELKKINRSRAVKLDKKEYNKNRYVKPNTTIIKKKKGGA